MCSETETIVRIDPRSAEAMRGHPVYAIMLLAGLSKTSEEDRTSSSIEPRGGLRRPPPSERCSVITFVDS